MKAWRLRLVAGNKPAGVQDPRGTLLPIRFVHGQTPQVGRNPAPAAIHGSLNFHHSAPLLGARACVFTAADMIDKLAAQTSVPCNPRHLRAGVKSEVGTLDQSRERLRTFPWSRATSPFARLSAATGRGKCRRMR